MPPKHAQARLFFSRKKIGWFKGMGIKKVSVSLFGPLNKLTETFRVFLLNITLQLNN